MTDHPSDPEHDSTIPASDPEPVREYTKPRLVRYGTVSKLTQNRLGSQMDAGQSNRRQCL